jgi:WD40 repeat protein
VRSVDWTDGGRTILQGNRMVGRRRGAMHSWSLATGRQVHAAMVYPDLPVVTMAMNASRDRAVAVHVSDSRVTVRLFAREGTAWRDVATLPEGQFREFCVAAEFLSPQLLLLCDTAGAVVLWDTAAGTFTRLPEGTMQSSSPIDHRRWMACTGLPDASSIWAGGAPGYVHRFDRRADGSFAVAEPVRFGDAIQVLHLLPDGSLMVGGMNGLLERLCVDGRRVRFGRHRTRVACIVSALLDGEVLLASGDQDGVICLWRDDGRLERAIEQTGGAVFALQFSPDAEQLLSGTRNGITRAWPVRTSRLLEIADRRRR